MRKATVAGFVAGICFLTMGHGCALAENSRMSDPVYAMIYEMAVQQAEAAGYENYEILIDDDYNVTVNVFESSQQDTKVESEEKEDSSDAVVEAEDQTEEAAIDQADVEEEISIGKQELEQENIVEAMEHFLKALPNAEAEKLVSENAYDYVDELIFSEEYEKAQRFMMDHPFDGYESMLAECNDYCFPLDMAKGLEARWKESEQDTSTWSDKKVRELYQHLVEDETEYLNKYMTMGFSDPQMADYAFAYIGALQSQQTGAAYYGIDSEKFNENWYDHGSDVRMRIIYLINRKYGLDINPTYNKTFKDAVAVGQTQDFVYAVSKMFTEQFSKANVTFRTGNHNYLYVIPFQVINDSGYSLTQYTVDLVFLDDHGKELGKQIVLAYETRETRDGKELSWLDGLISEPHFFSCYFRCEFSDISNSWYGCNVYPASTQSWDGQEIIDSKRSDSSDIISVKVEENKAYWTMSGDSFVPCAEFILRNDGNVNINDASVECIFMYKDDGAEWSRERYYALSSSDAALQPGQGRSVIVYSQEGYERKTRKVPNLSVEVYVNDEALAKFDVSRP